MLLGWCATCVQCAADKGLGELGRGLTAAVAVGLLGGGVQGEEGEGEGGGESWVVREQRMLVRAPLALSQSQIKVGAPPSIATLHSCHCFILHLHQNVLQLLSNN